MVWALGRGCFTRDQSGYGLSQWEEALLCNAFFLSLDGPIPKMIPATIVLSLEYFMSDTSVNPYGPRLNIKANFWGTGIHIIMIRRSWDCLFFMRIPILVRWHLYIEMVSRLIHWGRDKNGHHSDYIFKLIFLNEQFSILIKISLKFVLRCPVNNNAALVQMMAWRQTGNKPL